MTPPGTVNVAEQALLIDYLENGGNLYVESVNIGIDHFGTDFLETLGIKFREDGDFGDVEYITSTSTDLMEDIGFDVGGGDDPHFSVDVLNGTSATEMYVCEENDSRMFYLETDNYRAISSSVVFGALKDSDSLAMKTYLMAEIVNYFLGINAITDVEEALTGLTSMEVSTYPNPFTEQVNISVAVGKTSNVTIQVYDESGRMINNLFEGELSGGSHTFMWTGNTASGIRVNNGVYFYNVTIDGKSRSGKMLLSR